MHACLFGCESNFAEWCIFLDKHVYDGLPWVEMYKGLMPEGSLYRGMRSEVNYLNPQKLGLILWSCAACIGRWRHWRTGSSSLQHQMLRKTCERTPNPGCATLTSDRWLIRVGKSSKLSAT